MVSDAPTIVEPIFSIIVSIPTLCINSLYIPNAPLPDNGFTIINPINSFGILISFAIGWNINSKASIPPPVLNTPIAKNIPIMYLSFDTQTSNTGIKTRIEAFNDMLLMRKESKHGKK